MKTEEFFREIAAIPATTGDERAVAERIAKAFEPLCDDVRIDQMNSVIAHKKGDGPKVMVCAHLDEIGMMVHKIEDDGSLRMARVGGVDPRVMPGMRVRVYGKKQLMGVVGAKAPHLLSEKERGENYTFETLYVDLGMPADKVRELVRIGDMVCFECRYVEMKNGRVASKTADDRACVAMMWRAAEILKETTHSADIYFVASCQEEIGSYGAWTAGYAVAPDYAVAIDVCHAETPGAPPLKVHKLDSLVASKGPYINPFLREKLGEVADEQGVSIQSAVVPYYTSTDLDELSTARAGVPSVLLELPLKYMHTNVETFDLHALKEGARLLAHYLRAVDGTWEAELWN